MPNKKKQKKLNTNPTVSGAMIKGYIKRSAAKKAAMHAQAERFSEYSGKDKEKTQLRDADAPLTIQEKGVKGIRKLISYVKVHKAPRDERSVRHINPKLILVFLAAVCIALIVLSAVNEKVRAPFKYAASVFVVPAQKGINSIGTIISDGLKERRTVEQLESENAELKSKIDELSQQLLADETDRQELMRLREQVELIDDYEGYEVTAAHIIAKNPGKWFSTFTVDKGTNDGICKDMNVVVSGALVGIVTDSGPNYSTVRAIIDDESAVSAKFRDSSDLCMINGSLMLMEDNLLEFSNVSADVEINTNAAVVTSHVSSKYLPGLLIGYVADSQLDSNDLTQSGHIQPVVDFTRLEEVMIITTVKETKD